MTFDITSATASPTKKKRPFPPESKPAALPTMVMAVFAGPMEIAELNPVMSKVVESVSVATFPAAAVMDELSEVQLAMVLAMSVLTVLVLLLVALVLVAIAAANKERWSLAVAIGASMLITSMKIMRYPMRYMSFVPTAKGITTHKLTKYFPEHLRLPGKAMSCLV